MKSLPMIEKRASCEDLLSLVGQGEGSASSTTSLAFAEERRKRDKLKAEAQRRWIVSQLLLLQFNNHNVELYHQYFVILY